MAIVPLPHSRDVKPARCVAAFLQLGSLDVKREQPVEVQSSIAP
jgi:hypothetical protein